MFAMRYNFLQNIRAELCAVSGSGYPGIGYLG